MIISALPWNLLEDKTVALVTSDINTGNLPFALLPLTASRW